MSINQLIDRNTTKFGVGLTHALALVLELEPSPTLCKSRPLSMSFTPVSLSPTPGFCIKSTTLEPRVLPPSREAPALRIPRRPIVVVVVRLALIRPNLLACFARFERRTGGTTFAGRRANASRPSRPLLFEIPKDHTTYDMGIILVLFPK